MESNNLLFILFSVNVLFRLNEILRFLLSCLSINSSIFTHIWVLLNIVTSILIGFICALPTRIYVFTQYLDHVQDMAQGEFFECCKAGFNSEFSFRLVAWLSRVKEPALSYDLIITVKKTNVFMPFSRGLAQTEIQTTSFRIRPPIFFSYNDNHCAQYASWM